eukprot:c28447_g6_i1 orf=289-2283(-)
MGAYCCRTATVEDSVDLQSSGIDSNQKQASPVKAIVSQSHLDNMPSDELSARMDLMAKEPELSDVAYNFYSEYRQEKENTDDRDQNKLARVLSNKAWTAKSRTTLVAKKGAAKVNEVGSLLGRVGTAGLGKAVEALDTLGSSMTNLNLGSGFGSGAAPKGNKIGILAFEVANTIVKGFNLQQSLSEDNIRILKEDILHSDGVQRLVSTDMSELLRIAAADKRDELKIFTGEVVRFGNHCRDPQWHQLDRFFDQLGTEVNVLRQTKEEAEMEIQYLLVLAQHTAELYHEMHALDRFETDYRRKLQEEDFGNSQRGDSLAILRSELKSQKKHVKNLKKRSLWSKILEEVMDKLVDIVYFLHQEIQNAFGDAGEKSSSKRNFGRGGVQRLGAANLSLHYANIINQIDNLVSRPSSVPPSTRENLYQGLPPSIKASLRNRLQKCPFDEELSVPQIKAEMEKILSWLVPVATNTTKAHHGFGWVGEWATTGSSLDHKLPGRTEFTLLQTFHHADQKVTEKYILELIVWLHHLIILARRNVCGNKSPMRSPLQQKKIPPTKQPITTENGQCILVSPKLSPEDREMLKDVKNMKFTPGISRSQEFDKMPNAGNRSKRLSKSISHPPSTSTEVLSRRHVSLLAPLNFDTDKMKALDVIDRVDDYSMNAHPCT